MKTIKKSLLLIVALFVTIMCLGGILILFTILQYANFQQGKTIVIAIFLLLIAGFGLIAFKCFRVVFHRKEIIQHTEIVNIPVAKTHLEHEEITTAHVATPVTMPTSNLVIKANIVHQELREEIIAKMDDIPNAVKDLLWIKKKNQSYENNLVNEPSLESFYAYSADALLIAALYHKRANLISKIDLNKSSPLGEIFSCFVASIIP